MNIEIYFLTPNVKLFLRQTFSIKETLANGKPFFILRQTISDIQYVVNTRLTRAMEQLNDKTDDLPMNEEQCE